VHELQPLRRYLYVQRGYACDVATRPAEAGYQPNFDWVGSDIENGWNRTGRCLCHERGRSAAKRNKHVHLSANQFGCEGRQLINLTLRPTILDAYVLSFDVANLAQAGMETPQTIREQVGPFRAEKSNYW